MKLAPELIAVELLQLRAHRAGVEVEQLSAEPEGTGIDSLVENPVLSIALNTSRASRCHVEFEIIANPAEQNGGPELGFTMHAQKIQESSKEVNYGIW